MKAIIHFPNDPSVGFFPETFEAEIPFNTEQDVNDYGKEALRCEITKLYNTMYEECICKVHFDFENIND